MPKRWAMSAIVPKPSASPILALTVLIDREKASRSVTGPRWVRVELRGRPAVDRHRLVDDRVVGLHPGFERGEIDEQLEGGARLPLGLGRAVVDRIDIVAAADHRPDRAVAVERDQRALRARRAYRPLIGAVGRRLHAGIERGPDVDRIAGFVDQRVELRQCPVGEIADAVLLGRRLDLDVGGVDRAAADAAGRKPFSTIEFSTTPARPRAASTSAVGE